MAQWSLADRTLYAKLVYYGPALGGKTTNLRVLHERDGSRGTRDSSSPSTRRTTARCSSTSCRSSSEACSVTRSPLKLYTVPGQVRYDATRRAVCVGS